jgi:DNA polymerase III subunit beta
MKIVCNREQMLHAFAAVASVAPARSPKPILQNVKLEVTPEGATLMATDLEVGIRHNVPVAEVEVPGAAILPVTRFGSILRESNDESFRLENDGHTTIIKGQRSQFRLSGASPAEYPPVAGFDELSFYEIPARLLRELIRRTLFATDNESSRYALGGIKFECDGETMTTIGTDGRRLATMKGPISSQGEPATLGDATIVPAKSMQLVERNLADDDSSVQMALRQNEMLFRTPNVTIYSRLLEGRYPRWRDVFPQRANSMKLDLPVGAFLSAVRQAAIVTSDESRGVNFTFGDGTLTLSGQVAEVGQSHVELPISYDGTPISIMLDPRYLQDFLRVLDADKTVAVDLQDGDSAAVCSTDDGFGYVIMPLSRDR